MIALSYSDIWLKPKYSTLTSRSKADISVEFLGRRFASCVCPANMESVINEDIARQLSENGYFYTMHRFGDTQEFVEQANREKWKTISISIGVKNEDKLLIDWFGRGVTNPTIFRRDPLRIDFVTIDIANGHSILMKKMIEYVKYHLPYTKIIAGNVATPEGVRDLTNWGADACKVGVAGGLACATKHQTGFHLPMFSCIKECVEKGGSIVYENFSSETTIPIIADGGIKENGDIIKSLVAGATMVMAGSLFAACIDAPGENVYNGVASINPDNPLPLLIGKKYHGSASAKQKGSNKHIEGLELEIPCNGLIYAEKYREIKESIQSAISYGGGKNLECFESVEWVTTK